MDGQEDEWVNRRVTERFILKCVRMYTSARFECALLHKVPFSYTNNLCRIFLFFLLKSAKLLKQ